LLTNEEPGFLNYRKEVFDMGDKSPKKEQKKKKKDKKK
jgi:hypothetical protein